MITYIVSNLSTPNSFQKLTPLFDILRGIDTVKADAIFFSFHQLQLHHSDTCLFWVHVYKFSLSPVGGYEAQNLIPVKRDKNTEHFMTALLHHSSVRASSKKVTEGGGHSDLPGDGPHGGCLSTVNSGAIAIESWRRVGGRSRRRLTTETGSSRNTSHHN